jgi:hypothetical protein
MESHTALLSATVVPSEKLSMTLTGSYTDSTAEIDGVSFNEGDWTGYDPATQGYDYDLTGVEEYSDLDIQQFSLELDLSYELSSDLAMGLGLAVSVYEDNDPYLFDDDGVLYVLGGSVNYVF